MDSHLPMIHLLSFSPSEGENGVPISVKIDFAHDSLSLAYIRLLVGVYPVPTEVKEITQDESSFGGRWQLDALAPSVDVVGPLNSANAVQVTVQALDENNVVLESVICGQFTYWLPHDTFQFPNKRLLQVNSTGDLPHLTTRLSRRRALTLPSGNINTAGATRTVLQRRSRANSNARHQTVSPGPESQVDKQHTPMLELITPLSTITTNWSPDEISGNRRLVRFHKVLQGVRLIVSCEPISQEYYDSGPADFSHLPAVISCIYREENNTHYVTSVDIIYLLERLVEEEFPVEEKNRIRRNLEGLRPTTISKHKPGQEKFFSTIMEFPDPKPRNIEKDLKVFEWSLLSQALEKIISKYSVYTSTTPAVLTVSSSHLVPPARTPIMSGPSPALSVTDLPMGMDVNMFAAAKRDEDDGGLTPHTYLQDTMPYSGAPPHLHPNHGISRPQIWPERRGSSDSASASGSSGPNTAQWGTTLQEQQQRHFEALTTAMGDSFVLPTYPNQETYVTTNYEPYSLDYSMVDKTTPEDIASLLLATGGPGDDTSSMIAQDGSIAVPQYT